MLHLRSAGGFCSFFRLWHIRWNVSKECILGCNNALNYFPWVLHCVPSRIEIMEIQRKCVFETSWPRLGSSRDTWSKSRSHRGQSWCHLKESPFDPMIQNMHTKFEHRTLYRSKFYRQWCVGQMYRQTNKPRTIHYDNAIQGVMLKLKAYNQL